MSCPQASHSGAALERRLDELEHAIFGALFGGELRDPIDVELALASVSRWITSGQVTLEELVMEADPWTDLFEEYVEWVKGKIPISVPLQLNASPTWEHEEVFSVIALLYVQLAQTSLDSGTPHGLHIAAMAYADAVEHFARWRQMRGNRRCRSPLQSKASVHESLDRLAASPFVVEAGREKSSKGGQNRRKSVVMRMIRAEWLAAQRRRKPGQTDADFARQAHARYASEIDSERSIQTRISKWRRELEAGLSD